MDAIPLITADVATPTGSFRRSTKLQKLAFSIFVFNFLISFLLNNGLIYHLIGFETFSFEQWGNISACLSIIQWLSWTLPIGILIFAASNKATQVAVIILTIVEIIVEIFHLFSPTALYWIVSTTIAALLYIYAYGIILNNNSFSRVEYSWISWLMITNFLSVLATNIIYFPMTDAIEVSGNMQIPNLFYGSFWMFKYIFLILDLISLYYFSMSQAFTGKTKDDGLTIPDYSAFNRYMIGSVIAGVLLLVVSFLIVNFAL